jgi:hypothetical protein
LQEILPNGQLPSPENIGEFLKYDDTTILNEIKRHKDSNSNCKAIIERRQIRPILIKDIGSQEDQESDEKVKNEINEVEEILKQHRINIEWRDKIEKSWYDIDPTEVLVIDDNGENVKPLSSHSNILKNMIPLIGWRLYVKPEDKPRAEDVLQRWRGGLI